MKYKYEKYYLPILLFSLFIVLMYTKRINEGFDNSNGPTLAQITNPLLGDGVIKCYDYTDETKQKQYTLYDYMKPGFIPLTKSDSNIDVNNGEEHVTIIPCKRVRLKVFENRSNINNGDPHDFKYALSLHDINNLDACDFKDNKHPLDNTVCEGFGDMMDYVDQNFDIVSLLYISFLIFLLLIIVLNIRKKLV